GGLVAAGLYWREQRDLAESAREEAEHFLKEKDAEAALRASRRGLASRWFPGDGPVRQQLEACDERAVALAEEQQQQRRRERLTGQLGRLIDDLRFTWDPGAVGAQTLDLLEQRCARLWDQRDTLLAGAGGGR